MDIKTAIEKLEREWDSVRADADGFFVQLESGIFDETAFQRVQEVLMSLEVFEGETIDKRFVEVTWFIPTFMRWQQDAWKMDGKNTRELARAIDFVEMYITSILGLP